jgi:hypothetical protein
MDKNDDKVDDDTFVKYSKFLLSKGLNPDNIPYYLKPKFGLKISDFEKKTLKNYDNILTDFVNGSKLMFKKVGMLNFYVTNDDYDDDIVFWGNFPESAQYRVVQVGYESLRNIEFNHISGGYDYIIEKLTTLLNEKYPELKLNYPSKGGEDYNWELKD